MKKTVRTLALLLTLCFLMSLTAFADEAETNYDTYAVGTWNPSYMLLSGQRSPIPEDMPIVFNEDHTGTFNFFDEVYSFTWYYKGKNETSYVYELILKAPSGQVFIQNFVYFHDYKTLTGSACFMVGDDGTYIVYHR